MPKTKKPQDSSDSDSGPEDRNPVPAKKTKGSVGVKTAPAGNSKSSDGERQCWTLEKLRQVQINEFRGRKMVDIREFYEKDGKILPGKKGISLSITQWKKLVEIVDEVNAALNE